MLSQRILSTLGHTSEIFKRSSLIFKGVNAFWRIPPNLDLTNYSNQETSLGLYPLDYATIVKDGYYWLSDKEGLPVKPVWGNVIHNNTRLCGYAIGNWNLYYETNDEKYLEQVKHVADYLLRTADHYNNEVNLRKEILGQGHVGEISSMSQGQAISVFCRCFEATNDLKYLDAALKCIPCFYRNVDANGVVSTYGTDHLLWYEEFVKPPCLHVLNGMMYAMLGLFDLFKLTKSESIHDLYQKGVKSIEDALPSFDCGWWSWYGVRDDGNHYLASMGYHSLHIWQLYVLGTIADSSIMLEKANRFLEYTRHSDFRLRSIKFLVYEKAKKYFKGYFNKLTKLHSQTMWYIT
ncbi:D-glucuronyl C5-epimerase [Solitalea canadensis]|uniref:D-glucuronyl C5-epimerase n=1 Tax=Solitalea canadensis (strain ATCC 29591 / DSM 3403 / JCM 21819 / LMG 8368 / NBRC 15130 / NCIMB 12057 / USAM 9D) TaxID=929556 RepID=H8KLM6_SOLCM|nr:D-glucuronyl C5-epimerase [Solitalea canadensis]AFD08913.1 D-glucuronyl C5-epimerase [Solitalea canadensis DSM 3403]